MIHPIAHLPPSSVRGIFAHFRSANQVRICRECAKSLFTDRLIKRNASLLGPPLIHQSLFLVALRAGLNYAALPRVCFLYVVLLPTFNARVLFGPDSRPQHTEKFTGVKPYFVDKLLQLGERNMHRIG